jgi:hypothetical protein
MFDISMMTETLQPQPQREGRERKGKVENANVSNTFLRYYNIVAYLRPSTQSAENARQASHQICPTWYAAVAFPVLDVYC